MNIFFNGVWRMDWGFGNPNVTAAFIASLAIGIWGLAYMWRFGFWIAVVGFIPLEVCLLHTMSRGGILGAIVGFAILLFFAPRPWPKARLLAILIATWIGVGSAVFLKTTERLNLGIGHEDLSISNRLAIWKCAPQMLFDAPMGMGHGQSGLTYMAWYQPTDRHEQYLSLVNTHLSQIIELGILGGLLYVFLWAATLIIAAPSRTRPWRAIPLALLVAFGTAASFTNLVPWPAVWIVPAFALAMCIFSRLLEKEFPAFKIWAIGAGAAALLIFTLVVVGYQQQRTALNIHFKGDDVVIGSGEPSLIIVPDLKVMGREYARTLRRAMLRPEYAQRSILVTKSLAGGEKVEGKTVVCAGEIFADKNKSLGPLVANAKEVIILSPKIDPREIGVVSDGQHKTRVYVGEFSQLLFGNSWEQYARLQRVEGAGDFLPNWPDLIFEQKESMP